MSWTQASAGDLITNFDLVPRNAACLPDAAGRVTVFHKEDAGVDTLLLRVRGPPANTDLAVFLTSADAFATKSSRLAIALEFSSRLCRPPSDR